MAKKKTDWTIDHPNDEEVESKKAMMEDQETEMGTISKDWKPDPIYKGKHIIVKV